MDLIAGACAAVRRVAIKFMIEKRGEQRLKYLVLSHQAILRVSCVSPVQHEFISGSVSNGVMKLTMSHLTHINSSVLVANARVNS